MNNNHWKIILVAVIITLSMSGCKGKIPLASATPLPTTSPIQIVTQSVSSTLTPTIFVSASETNVPAETPVISASENPLAPEKNPPGDIPDTQVFLKYTNTAGGYELQVPEGWARTETGTNVAFEDKFDGVQVAIAQSSDPLTVDSVKNIQVSNLQKTGRAIQIKSVVDKKTKSVQAILVTYESNSEPDAVTGKQVRLEDQCYYYYKDGKLAALTLWAPLGADNVDQWKLMSDSFRWK